MWSVVLVAVSAFVAPQAPVPEIKRAEACAALNEPPCSYVAVQATKDLVRPDDRCIAWIRGKHNGGAAPLRHFLAGPRVVNDTYGLFFYDPEGGYVAAYQKDYGYRLHGWRQGVMVVQHDDGTLFSALTGLAFAGPRQGQQLQRVPSYVTHWGAWVLMHPESTAYDLFDGAKYPVVELPTVPNPASLQSRGPVDPRLPADAWVLGVRVGDARMAFPLDHLPTRAVLQDKVGGWTVAVLWSAATQSATAFRAVKDETLLTLQPDAIAPEVAPFRDTNTGTRWSMAGRAIDGILRGHELTWVDSIQCRWFAWAAEHPSTAVHQVKAADGENKGTGK